MAASSESFSRARKCSHLAEGRDGRVWAYDGRAVPDGYSDGDFVYLTGLVLGGLSDTTSEITNNTLDSCLYLVFH